MTGTAVVKLSPKAEAYLVNYNSARKSLATCVRVDEVKKIRDANVAVQVYAKLAKDTELEDMATEIRLRAERRAGEILIKMKETGERATGGGVYGGRPATGQSRASKFRAKKRSETDREALRDKPKPLRLRDIGITEDQAGDWQKLARVPEKQFERDLAAAKDHTPTPRKKPEHGKDVHHLTGELYRFIQDFVKKADRLIAGGEFDHEDRLHFVEMLVKVEKDCAGLREKLREAKIAA